MIVPEGELGEIESLSQLDEYFISKKLVKKVLDFHTHCFFRTKGLPCKKVPTCRPCLIYLDLGLEDHTNG